ncbi:MAG: sigma-70 family RNA polymerase sigma factor [Verrucomicrobiota bacterium]|jgi:RNA polymerase sigma-70 factor (ECF subfamily)
MDDTGENAKLMEQIYRDFGPELLAFFQRRHDSPQMAEDLLQETFAAAMKHPDRLLQADSPRAYLFGMARNLSAEMHRRSRPTEELPAEPTMAEAETADPRLEVMREGIERLNAASRQVLELRLQRELSYEEMAASLGVPVGTVRSRLHHAVRQLRAHLKNSDYEK